MDGNNEDKKYDLYTEHIVSGTGRKIKRVLKKMLLVLAMAVFFGLVAGLVMIIVYRAGNRFFPEQSKRPEVTLPSAVVDKPTETETESEDEVTTPHETVTIPAEPETTSEPETEPPSDEDETIPGIEDIKVMHEAYKAVVSKVGSSLVTVTVSEVGEGWFSAYQNVSYESGLLVAADSDWFYILTDYRVTSGGAELSVAYSGGAVKNAELVMGDPTTGMAVIRTGIVDDESVRTASFGNSASVTQGDALIAMGKIYGYTGTVGYGIAAGVGSRVSDTDSEFLLINTDIAADSSVSGVLCNLSGEVVGIITAGYNSSGSGNFVSAYAVSGIRRQIENLINARQKAYLGIKGQTVTAAIQQLHGIPEGVYLSAVEVNSPAYSAGIQTGDVITAIGRENVTDMSSFMEAMSKYAPADTVEIKVKRKGRDSYKEIVFRVALGVQ